jgi:hypothetical protein
VVFCVCRRFSSSKIIIINYFLLSIVCILRSLLLRFLRRILNSHFFLNLFLSLIKVRTLWLLRLVRSRLFLLISSFLYSRIFNGLLRVFCWSFFGSFRCLILSICISVRTLFFFYLSIFLIFVFFLIFKNVFTSEFAC